MIPRSVLLGFAFSVALVGACVDARAQKRILGQSPPNVTIVLFTNALGIVEGVRDVFREARGSARFTALSMRGDPQNIDRVEAAISSQPPDAILVEGLPIADMIAEMNFSAPIIAIVADGDSGETDGVHATIQSGFRPADVLEYLRGYLGDERPFERILIVHALTRDDDAETLALSAQAAEIDTEAISADPAEWAAADLVEDIVSRNATFTMLMPVGQDGWFWIRVIDQLRDEGVLTATVNSPVPGAMFELNSDPYGLGRLAGAHLLVGLETSGAGEPPPDRLARPKFSVHPSAFDRPETAPSLGVAKQALILR